MLNCFVADAGRGARPVHAIAAASYRDWLGGQPAHVRAWLEGSQFEAKPGRSALLPGADGAPGAALLLHERTGRAMGLRGAARASSGRRLAAGTG